MPRKFIKKHLPSEQTLRGNTSLKWLSKYIKHPSLWHLNRKSVSRAFLAGVFCAFLPIPMQMVVAALLAILIRANLAVSIGLVWISNPLTMPPIFFFTYSLVMWHSELSIYNELGTQLFLDIIKWVLILNLSTLFEIGEYPPIYLPGQRLSCILHDYMVHPII